MVPMLRKSGPAVGLAIEYRLQRTSTPTPPPTEVREASSGQPGPGPVGVRDRRSLHTRWWTFQRPIHALNPRPSTVRLDPAITCHGSVGFTPWYALRQQCVQLVVAFSGSCPADAHSRALRPGCPRADLGNAGHNSSASSPIGGLHIFSAVYV